MSDSEKALKTKFLINLNEISKVTEFVKNMNTLNSDVNLISGRYVVNAKSVLGVYSLDLSKPIKVEIVSCSDKDLKDFNYYVEKYVVNGTGSDTE